MFQDLWLLNLYLAANTLVVLAFGAFAWIFFDAYAQQKKRCHLARGIGGVITGASFFWGLLEKVYGDVSIFNSYVTYSLFVIGLATIAYGYYTEEIPGLPKLKKKTKKRGALLPIFTIASSAISFILSIIITVRVFKKVGFGKSKEYRLILVFWVFISIYSLFQLLKGLGANDMVWLDEWFRDYSVMWIVSQVILIIASITLFTWLFVFISFRVFARLFLIFWNSAIVFSIILASVYSIFTVTAAENQVLDLLHKNAKLVVFNLSQVRSNNNDLLEYVIKDDKLTGAIEESNYGYIKDSIEGIIHNNENIDRILVLDKYGISLYDTDDPEVKGQSFNGNVLVNQSIQKKTTMTGYTVEEITKPSKRLISQYVYPVIKGDQLIGLITTIKRVDDNYLDFLKEQTDQELIVYVEGQRSASTIIEEDGLSRVENIPEPKLESISNIDEEIKIGNTKFARARIVTTPYYVASITFDDLKKNKIASLIIGTKQSLLIETTENALYNTFIVALVLSILSTVPSYFLAKSLKRNLSV